METITATGTGDNISSGNALFDFTGRRVLVTGGGQGIGKGIALKFLQLNATVIVLDKNADLLEKLKEEYPSIETVSVDLRDWEATRAAVHSVLPIHHLANNAGYLETKPILEADEALVDKIFDVNFKGALNVAQVVAKGMIANQIQNGTVVNTSSVGDTVVFPNASIYAASKAAITMLTKSMAVELARHGIRVNFVRPNVVKTEMVSNLPPEVLEAQLGPILNRMLFRDFVQIEHVANSVAFLSSSLAASITGTGLTVDQGYTIQ